MKDDIKTRLARVMKDRDYFKNFEEFVGRLEGEGFRWDVGSLGPRGEREARIWDWPNCIGRCRKSDDADTMLNAAFDEALASSGVSRVDASLPTSSRWTLLGEVFIPIEPKGKARPRVTNGHAFMPKDYMAWKKQFGALWMAGDPVVVLGKDTHIKVAVQVYTKTGNMRSDLDNVYAAVMDALQDCGAIPNDRQLKAIGDSEIVQSKEPGLLVAVWTRP